MLFLSPQSGQAAQRLSGNPVISPRVDLLNAEKAFAKFAKVECRKLVKPAKVHAARPCVADFLPPPATAVSEPHAWRSGPPPVASAACERPKATRLVARGPPA